MKRLLFVVSIASVAAAACADAQTTSAWRDPTDHRISFVAVKDVRLEVLDWGGVGRPIALLAGGGSTAHVFDQLAPKLTDCCHVYGITRRGFGESSHPTSGYDDQTLADDVVGVLDAMHLDKPVLVGHSMAGGELTTIGREHPGRISGLVFLEALFEPGDTIADPAFVALQQKLPAAMTKPPTLDSSSFFAYQASQEHAHVGAFPESELRQLFAEQQNGGVGRYKASTGAINAAIGTGQRKRDYANIIVPVLAFVDYPVLPGDPLRTAYQPANDDERAAITAYTVAERSWVDKRMAALKRSVPDARVILLPAAGHFVFLTRETDVLKELHRFLAMRP